jgi:hypothetical protein
MTITSVTAQTWPHVDIRSIDDVPGAPLVRAWMVNELVLAGFDDTLDESEYESGMSYVKAALPGLDIERDALPQSLRRGDSATLIVLWDIDNCDALPQEGAQLKSRTFLGTSSTEIIPDIGAPGFDVEVLRRTGICD